MAQAVTRGVKRHIANQKISDVVSFFFFQAEDGIRDVAVTGVQTCALPISPHVTVISVSGFTVIWYQSAYLRARASRSRLAPQVMAYWFTSSRIARAAASFRTSGAGKFGNPWARLMAPCSLASRVIPRITDSVNECVRRAVCIEAEVTSGRPRRDSPGPSVYLLLSSSHYGRFPNQM